MICLLCGTKNSLDNKLCLQCGNDLTPVSSNRPHTSQLLRIIEKTKQGNEITLLKDTLNNFRLLLDELNKKQKELQKNVPPDLADQFKEFREATLLLFDAIEELEAYLEDKKMERLHEASRLIKQAELLHYDIVEDIKEQVKH